MTDKQSIFGLEFEVLNKILQDWGEKAYRAIQIWQGLYQHFWLKPEEFSTLSKTLRQQIADHFCFSHLSPVKNLVSSNGVTQKTLFRLPDGYQIETVLMDYNKRHTLCISTQVGCAIGCTFCATGQMGFHRHLSSGEIVEQVIRFARQLHDANERITNVVIMGMGEPFHNYDETMSAIHRLNDSKGFNLGARRFTISTVGIVPMIKRFTSENTQVNLAVSLHAADDDLRSSIIPINDKYPISALMDACHLYVEKTKRRITFEYALIQGFNDQIEHANKLAAILHGLVCHVNLIPLNPIDNYPKKGSSRLQVAQFKSVLDDHNIPCSIRLPRGIDIQAGCGQLATS